MNDKYINMWIRASDLLVYLREKFDSLIDDYEVESPLVIGDIIDDVESGILPYVQNNPA